MDPTTSSTSSLGLTTPTTTTSINNITSSTGTSSTTSTDSNSAAAGFDALSGNLNFFLTMLTTQLQQQDPTAPMDVSQMTAQIAQFSGVQQQVDTNSNLEKLITASNQTTLGTAVSYIGKEVETEGTTGEVVGGQGAFAYVLPSAASSVKVTISDSTGAAVFTGDGTTNSGHNEVVWDGTNSFTGATEPDGTYTIAVTATDSTGAALTPDIRAIGIVAGVETDSTGTIKLNVGDGTVNYSDILAVRDPNRLATTTDTSDSGTSSTTGTDTSSSGTTTTTGTDSAT